MPHRLLPRRFATRRYIGIAVAAALLPIMLVGGARADVPIAVVGPMTGQYALLGEQMRRAGRQGDHPRVG